MNSQEIERLVTIALQTDAEDAMSRTNTTEELLAFREASSRDVRGRRRLQVAGALAAVAAVVAVVVVTWPGDGNRTAPPVGPTRTERVTEAEQVATGFVESLAAFDRSKAATYVDPASGLTLGTAMRDDGVSDPWDLRNRWDEATGWKVTRIESCRQTSVRPDAIGVRCRYAAHQLGSERLGRGPFAGNELNLTVRDGAIVAAELATAHESNGFASTMWNPFFAWIDRTHPGDAQALAVFEQTGATPAEVDRSLRLWHQRVQQYVAAVRAGTAD